jgi:hypothetical protein
MKGVFQRFPFTATAAMLATLILYASLVRHVNLISEPSA